MENAVGTWVAGRQIGTTFTVMKIFGNDWMQTKIGGGSIYEEDRARACRQVREAAQEMDDSEYLSIRYKVYTLRGKAKGVWATDQEIKFIQKNIEDVLFYAKLKERGDFSMRNPYYVED